MTKQLKTLPEDIYALFDPSKSHEVDEANVERAGELFKDLLRTRLKEREPVDNPLRFSSMGKPDRQIWYMANSPKGPEDMSPKTYFKFLYGDVIELLVLFLAAEAGHDVDRMQEEIEVDGVLGHIDAIVDGTVVDVKSASPFSFKKFKDNTILEEDPFGYAQQLGGYTNVLTPGQSGAWVAFDKVHGDICVTNLSASVIKDYDPFKRIQHLKELIKQDQPPERCYEDVPEGKSGNRKLGVACSYCAFKHECWPQMRTFLYAKGPVYLTEVKREPKAFEVKSDEKT